jgi:uncharacterized delta-60 repeat protein
MTAVICSLLVAGPSLAADPCSDPMCADEGFGASGRVAIDFAYGDADRGNAVIRVPGQDRLYVIGQVSTAVAGDDDFGVACLLDDGSPCPDFGFSGTATVAMDFTPGGLDAAIAGAVLPSGTGRDWRLVVVGQVEATSAADTDFGVALLRPDGSLETDASGGKVRAAFDVGADFTDLPAAVAVTADGKILVGGTVDIAAGDSDWGFVRLNADLTLDTTFGTNGVVLLDVSGLAVMHAMLLQRDGKIVAVGSRDFGDDQMVIARLNADGSPDTFFGFLGQTVFDFDLGGSNDDSGWGVASDSDERLIIVGEADFDAAPCWAAARVLPNGAPDTSFSSGSATAHDCFGFGASAGGRAVAVFPDGRPIIALETDYNGDHDFSIMRWEGGGMYSTFFYPFDLGGSDDDRPRSILIQPDGKIVVAGRVVGPNETLDFGVLRVWSHQIFADGFEAWGSAAEWDSITTTK